MDESFYLVKIKPWAHGASSWKLVQTAPASSLRIWSEKIRVSCSLTTTLLLFFRRITNASSHAPRSACRLSTEYFLSKMRRAWKRISSTGEKAHLRGWRENCPWTRTERSSFPAASAFGPSRREDLKTSPRFRNWRNRFDVRVLPTLKMKSC